MIFSYAMLSVAVTRSFKALSSESLLYTKTRCCPAVTDAVPLVVCVPLTSLDKAVIAALVAGDADDMCNRPMSRLASELAVTV
jgi:hypothetical protein